LNYHGDDYFVYHASDGISNSITATVFIIIDSINDLPVAVEDFASTPQDTPLSIAVLDNDSDPDGSTLMIQSVTTPAHGSAVISGTLVLYTPAAGYAGLDYFEYTCEDNRSGTDSAQVTVDISNTNLPPVLSDLAKSGPVDAPITFSSSDFSAHFSDANGDGLVKIQVTSLPANGVLQLNGAAVTINQEITAANLGKLTFTPTSGWTGSTSFQWNASDGLVYAAAPASVNIQITGGGYSIYLPVIQR